MLATMLLIVVLVLMALNVVLQRVRAKRDIRATGGLPNADVGLELAEASARG